LLRLQQGCSASSLPALLKVGQAGLARVLRAERECRGDDREDRPEIPRESCFHGVKVSTAIELPSANDVKRKPHHGKPYRRSLKELMDGRKAL